MNVVLTVVLALQMLTALGMIGLILLQHGKGADMGAAFGSGASGSLFGATGSANFLSRTTAVLAAVFFVLSLALAYTATRRPAEEGGGVIDAIRNRQQPPQTPAKPASPASQSSVPAPEAPVPATPAPTAPAPAAPSDKQVPQ